MAFPAKPILRALALWVATPIQAHSAEGFPGLRAEERTLLGRRAETGVATVLSVDNPESHRRLEQPSRPVDPRTPELPTLIADMTRAAQAGHGAGLAAVQIGIPVRVALLARATGFQAFLNPERTWASAETLGSWERCLSVPWGYRYTERPARIAIRYQTPDGATRTETLSGDEAVVFQQELDHLDGHLLSGGHNHRWFIPEAEMRGFVSALGGCADLVRAECRALAKSRWEARARAAANQ